VTNPRRNLIIQQHVDDPHSELPYPEAGFNWTAHAQWSFREFGSQSAPRVSDDPRLQAIETRLRLMERSLDILVARSEDETASIAYGTWLTRLRSSQLQLQRPIPVVIQEYDDEVGVSWVEAELTGLGDSLHDAFTSFEQQLLELYEYLVGPDAALSGESAELGPLPQHWRALLMSAVAPIHQP
jgi:hypothetical protein